MAKKNTEKTPRSQIKGRLRQIWLRSRERATACKRDKYTCQHCGIKQSKAKGREVKIEVHHKHGIVNWNELVDMFIDKVLQTPEDLIVLCKECHKKLHDDDKKMAAKLAAFTKDIEDGE